MLSGTWNLAGKPSFRVGKNIASLVFIFQYLKIFCLIQRLKKRRFARFFWEVGVAESSARSLRFSIMVNSVG